MGAAGCERGFAHRRRAACSSALGLAGSIGNPIVGRPGTTGVFVTGFGHDLAHLVCGALFLHIGIALTGRQRAYGLVGLGVFLLVTRLLSLVEQRPPGPLRCADLGLRPARPPRPRPGRHRHRLDGSRRRAPRVRSLGVTPHPFARRQRP